MPIPNLAPELVRHFLSYLDRESLKTTNLVCHAWLAQSNGLYWADTDLYLFNRIPPGDLDTLLGSNSNIPRRLRNLTIAQPLGYDEEVMTRWRDGVHKILAHFNRIKHMRISNLDLTKFPPEQRKGMFNDISITESLGIGDFEVVDISDVAFMFNNRNLRLWDILTISFGGYLDRIIEAATVIGNECSINLSSLERLVVRKNPKFYQCIIWSKVLPQLKGYMFKRLKTVVVVCKEPHMVSGVVDIVEAAGPALRSLAIGMGFEGFRFGLSNNSIVSLSLDISECHETELLLSDLIYTLTRVPNLERIFLNVGRSRDPAVLPVWRAFDSHLSQMDSLKVVIFMHVACYSQGWDDPGREHAYSMRLLNVAEKLLPACRNKGLLRAELFHSTYDGWVGEPFGRKHMPE